MSVKLWKASYCFIRLLAEAKKYQETFLALSLLVLNMPANQLFGL
jgi:hypothetical protein